jgi:hypothetical protein
MDQLQRFIDLVNKTGDKLVVFDKQNPDKSFVILAINDYERLAGTAEKSLGLTEDELADKINGDIAIWKNEQILADVSEPDFNWLETEDEYDDEDDEEMSESEEEELNYLYGEPEINFPAQPTTLTIDALEADDSVEVTPMESSEESDSSPTKARPEFQSLADILDTRFDKAKSNSWSIPSDRKKQAETADEIRKYETIGF